MNLDNVFVLISVMVLSFLSVNIFKAGIRDKSKEAQQYYSDAIYRFFGKAALGILLPILFFESFVNNADHINEILVGVGYGAAFAGFTLMVGGFLSKILSSDYVDQITHVVGATFGGGNRGVVLMIVTMSLLSLDDAYFSYFYAVDFGNFMFFLFAIPLYLRVSYGKGGDAPTYTVSSTLKELGVGNLVIICVVILLLLDVGSEVAKTIADFIAPTADARSFLLLYLSFCLIFLKIDMQAAHTKIIANIAFITLSRLVVLLLLGMFIIKGTDPVTAHSVLTNGYLLSLIILFFCPPSSLIGGQIDLHAGDEKAVVFANTLNVYMVFMYFGAICMILFLSYIASTYGFSFI